MTPHDLLPAVPTIALLGVACLCSQLLRPTRPEHRLLVSLLVCGCAIRYVIWRFSSTLPPFEASLGVAYAYAFLLGEAYLIVHSVQFFWRLRAVPRDAPPPSAAQPVSEAPLVDVLIPTYNESEDVIERTVVGAASIRHERLRIWLLDDSARPWLRERAAEWGCRYLARVNGMHGKAGNLNHALSHIREHEVRPDYVVVFDADFIPQANFLEETLPLFADPSVALVQTPQVFFNPDPFQYAFGSPRGWPDSQRYLYEVDLPIRNASGGATCCGTSFVVRHHDLLAQGGFPIDSISEDTLLSLRLSARGRRTVYLNRPLSMGLAAEGFAEHLTQQARWCLGWMQIARTEFGPLGPQRLSLLARVRGLDDYLEWGLGSALRLLFTVTPILYWFFGVSPLEATSAATTAYFLPMWLASALGGAWLTRKIELPFYAEMMTLSSASVIVRASIAGLFSPRNRRFVVTDKGRKRDSINIHWSPLLSFVLLGLLTIAGMASYLLHGPPDSGGLATWTFCWSFFNLLVLFMASVPCVEPPQRRAHVRFATDEVVEVALAGVTQSSRLRDLGVAGAALGLQVPDSVEELQIRLDEVGWVRARPVRRAADSTGLRLDPSAEQHRRLIAKLYSFRYVRPVRSGAFSSVLLSVLRKAFAW